MDIQSQIDKCILSKLTKNAEESEHHGEYGFRTRRLEVNFDSVIKHLSELNLKEKKEETAHVLASVYILYKELLSEGLWHSDNDLKYAKKLQVHCQVLYEVDPQTLLKTTDKFDNQKIFDECMQILLCKLTSSHFKKYPSLIEVFCSVVEDIQDYKNISIDAKPLPISLYLIDDYNQTNKKKGLNCCRKILRHLKPETFSESSYYEVVYVSLKKALVEKDLDITKLVVRCLMELLGKITGKNEFKLTKSEELYANILDQIQVESNLHRKAELFNFMKHLIEIIGVNAVRRKAFQTVLCDNLDISCNEGVGEILLVPVLECFEEWIKNCWCAWKLSTDQKTLSTLFKVLYVSNETTADKVSRIIATLITLCEKEDKEKIIKNLEEPKMDGTDFLQKLNLVNKYIIS